MKTPTRNERDALAQMDKIGNAEDNRANWWEAIPLRDRQRAVGVAGLGKECADLALSDFNDTDREHIRLAIGQHIATMELIQRCMAGRSTNVQGYLH
ncbi:hypothetical protein [Duganella violaceipulchra]|uniref:Uncharacterized protein n=1 Tax=Duganella violaceipulchra TaxID=2849652 RepID=A0AA41HBT2_9BURK|nr:hypothetical protein [Duganella violaceicalia]MBV6324374.1 hypothetical protein [Duganella violaceicalia]MCP2007232.1 hypothetical protein [Duganella violaceicalia]